MAHLHLDTHTQREMNEQLNYLRLRQQALAQLWYGGSYHDGEGTTRSTTMVWMHVEWIWRQLEGVLALQTLHLTCNLGTTKESCTTFTTAQTGFLFWSFLNVSRLKRGERVLGSGIRGEVLLVRFESFSFFSFVLAIKLSYYHLVTE